MKYLPRHSVLAILALVVVSCAPSTLVPPTAARPTAAPATAVASVVTAPKTAEPATVTRASPTVSAASVQPTPATVVVTNLMQVPGLVEHVEVAYFHTTQRCASCLEVERLTRKTLDTFFSSELKSGAVSLVVADVQKSENAALVKKYDAFAPALYLGARKGGTWYIWMDSVVWLMLDDEAKFMDSLRASINTARGFD